MLFPCAQTSLQETGTACSSAQPLTAVCAAHQTLPACEVSASTHAHVPDGAHSPVTRAHPPWRMHARGLTLVELMISVLISSIVLSLVMSGMNSISRQLTRVQSRTEVSDEARRLTEYLVDRFRQAGGGNIRPHAAIWVENNYQESGSDSIVVAHLASYQKQFSGVLASSDLIAITSQPGASCVLTPDVLRRQLLVMDRGDRAWRLYYISSIDLVACTMTVLPSTETGLNYGSTETLQAAGLLSLCLVNISRYWLDQTTGELKLRQDGDLNNVFTDAILADRMVDLQAALAYDIQPWDWRLSDKSSTGDEWLYNAFGDQLGGATGQLLDAARRTDLRMIRVSVMVGMRLKGSQPNSSLQLMDGPLRTRQGWLLAATMTGVGLRNYNMLR